MTGAADDPGEKQQPAPLTQRLLRQNMNILERYGRVIVGTALITLVYVGPESLWGWVGLYPTITAVLAMDPIYALLDFDTLPSD